MTTATLTGFDCRKQDFSNQSATQTALEARACCSTQLALASKFGELPRISPVH